MKNNKGMTLVEIIIAIAPISIVLLFLFMLLITVNDINQESEVNSTYLINKSLILKNIEEDLRKTDKVKISECKNGDASLSGIRAFYSSYPDSYDATYFDNNEDNRANFCLMLTYSTKDADDNFIEDTNPAYIAIYYYKNQKNYVISYIHGDIKATRVLPDFVKYNIKSGDFKNDNFKPYISLSDSSKMVYNALVDKGSDGFSTITIPIIGPDEKDYSIIISYYGEVEVKP